MSSHRRGLRTSAFALAVGVTIGIAALGHSSAADAGVGCDRVAAPNGSDSGAGTEADPLRTAQKLVDSLAAGETGCLRSGTFSEDDQTKLRTPGITLSSYPGERATLKGQLRIERTATGAVVEGLTLDGRNPRDLLGPLVYADRAVLRANDISNGHSAICVHVDDYYDDPAPQGVVIERNRIHDCGRLPATNKDHGIYMGKSRNAVIRDNWIYDNADRGIQLYPDADRTTITGNVIDGNGQGIIFGSSRSDSPDGNLVEGNVITNSTIRYNVESHSQGAPYGSGNVVRRNCVSGGARDDGDGGIQATGKGFTASDNLLVDPRYVNRAAKDFTLKADSPCRSLATGTGPDAPAGGSDSSTGGSGSGGSSGSGDSSGSGAPSGAGSSGSGAETPQRGTKKPDRRKKARALVLAARKAQVPHGRRVKLGGRAPAGVEQVRLMRRRAGRWKSVRLMPVGQRGFSTKALINRRAVKFRLRAPGGLRSRVTVVRSKARG